MIQIHERQAYLHDRASVAKLLASIPWPHSVGSLLRKSFFARKWDGTHQSDYWLASDGTMVVSVRISGASAAAVAKMRMRFDDLRVISPRLQPSGRALHDLLAGIAREDGGVAQISLDAARFPPGRE